MTLLKRGLKRGPIEYGIMKVDLLSCVPSFSRPKWSTQNQNKRHPTQQPLIFICVRLPLRHPWVPPPRKFFFKVCNDRAFFVAWIRLQQICYLQWMPSGPELSQCCWLLYGESNFDSSQAQTISIVVTDSDYSNDWLGEKPLGEARTE